VDKHVASIWGTPAKLIKSKDFVKDDWAMVFLDDADQPGALAYHDLTPDGLPLSKVFVKLSSTITNWSVSRRRMNWSRCWWIQQSTCIRPGPIL